MVRPFHVMTKPVGSSCNLSCDYCYYLEKSALYDGCGMSRMSDEVLESFVRQYIESQPGSVVTFAWQGGEPTLFGIPFFRKALSLQRKYGEGRTIENALQTNGTLLNKDWALFLKEENFLVGISIDGPEDLHDRYRTTRGGRGSFQDVMRGWEVLSAHEVETNTLTVVNRWNSRQPERVYSFLKEIGSRYLQFIPIVERLPNAKISPESLDLAAPPDADHRGERIPVTEWSVRPKDFGTFLCRVFDLWQEADIGKIFVQHFDGALGKWLGMPGGLCVFDKECGSAMALERNGDLYSCDHYVYPQYRLGNITERTLSEMAESPEQKHFGGQKSASLSATCRRCPYLFACNGDCPKHRFVPTGRNAPMISYLCPGLRTFFRHIDQPMRSMAARYR